MQDSQQPVTDRRHHVSSLLMRESLLDKQVMSSTETPVVRMLADCHVIKVGGRSILDGGKASVYPLVEAIAAALAENKLIIGVGGGVRSRHTYSIGIDLGLPTGVLAQLVLADALGNAHMLGTLLAPYGVVAPPPEVFGHLLPFIMQAAPGVIFNGDPPYTLWEHPPSVGRIPPHRSDAGAYLLAECFGGRRRPLRSGSEGAPERPLHRRDHRRRAARAESANPAVRSCLDRPPGACAARDARPGYQRA
jgi:molybdenum storage protein